jgi:hypothetical protein
MEHLLALWAVQQAFWRGEAASRLVLVGGRTVDYDIAPANPKGRMMLQLVAAVFGNSTRIVRPSEFARAARGSALLLDRAAVSSRMTCHRNKPSSKLNKMLAAHARAIQPHAGSFRRQLLRGLGVQLPPKQPLRPVPAAPPRKLRVGVVDRGGSSRRLSADFKAAIMRALNADPRFDAFLLRFQNLPSAAEQVRAAAQLDVMIGCHGNGLTHALLMRPPAVLVELFPASMNHADYQLHADYGGHRHFGWSDREGLLTRSPYVVECAEQYGVYARYRRKSDPAIFTGVGGNATIAKLLELAHRLVLAPDDRWREAVAPRGECARDGRM